MKDKNLQKNA